MQTTDSHRVNEPYDLHLARLCHETRTALTTIIGHRELLQRHIPDPSDLARIIEASLRLNDFITTLEDFRKAQAGHLTLTLSQFHLSFAIAPVLDTIYPSIKAKSLNLRLHLPTPLPPLTADLPPIRQILLHLLSNAIQFTPPGGRIRLTPELDRNDRLSITVADTGIGIASDDLTTIFEPFTVLNPNWSPNRKSRGLGLPLTRHLVTLHGGTISAHSNGPGQGSRFIIRLPTTPTSRTLRPMTSGKDR